MIYLIVSRGEDFQEGKGNIRTYYKIGYTGDKGTDERRFSTYYLHNPFCKILCTIPGGTVRHESLIHNRFKNLRVYRKEWYEDDATNSIINFFNTYKTVDDLNNVLGVGDPRYFVRGADGKLTEEFQNLRSYVKNCLNIFYNKKITSLNPMAIESELTKSIDYFVGEIGKSIFTEDDFLDKFEEDRGENIRQVLEENEKLLEKPISDFIEEFNSLSDFNDKMKSLCESNFSESEISVILDQVPLTYKKYYLVLGPGRCKALSYNVTLIRKEYEDTVMDKGEMKNEIYKTFEVGKVYLNKEIKNKLTGIYNSCGYNKIPKANDIKNYFKVMRARKRVENKQIEGIRILDKL